MDSFKLKQFQVLLGCILINIPICVSLYFGNLYTYMISVYYQNPPAHPIEINADWITSLHLVIKAFGFFISQGLKMALPYSVGMLIGISLFSGSFFLTYFLMNHSVPISIIVFMLLNGLANGMTSILSLMFLPNWFGKRVGLMTSIVTGFGALGSVAFNQIVTNFINPHNLNPDATWNSVISYFSQPEISQRVPYVFLILGGIALVLQIIGLVLMMTPKVKHIDLESSLKCTVQKNGEASSLRENGKDVFNTTNYSTIKDKLSGTPTSNNGISDDVSIVKVESIDFDNTNLRTENENNTEMRNYTIHNKNNKNNDTISGETFQEIQGNGENKNKSCEDTKRHIAEILRFPTYYFVGVSFFALAAGLPFVLSYFKLFGQMWIDDDKFLAMVGSTYSAVSGVFQISCGYICDTFGMKSTLIIHTAVGSFCLFNWYMSAVINKWLYLICTCILSGIFNNTYILSSLAGLKLFGGTRFYALNSGMVQLPAIVAFLGFPQLICFLLPRLGWFWSFILVGCINLFALIIVALKLK